MPRALNDDGNFKYSAVTGRGLGYYVHYHAANYARYGITVNSEEGGNSSNFAQAIKENHDYLKTLALRQSRIEQAQDRKELTEFLNSFMDPVAFNQALQHKFHANPQQAQAIVDRWTKALEEHFSSYNIDLEALSVERPYKLNNYLKDNKTFRTYNTKKIYNTKTNTPGSQNKIYESTFNRLQADAKSAISGITRLLKDANNGLSQADLLRLKQYKNDLTNLKARLERLQNSLPVYYETTFNKQPTKVYRLDQNYASPNGKAPTKNRKKWAVDIINQMNDIFDALNYPTSEAQGEILEYATSAGMAIIQEELGNGLKDLIGPDGAMANWLANKKVSSYTAVQKGSFLAMDYYTEILNANQITGFKKGSHLNGSYQIKDGATMVVNTTQNTVDIMIDFPDGSSLSGLNGLGASLKSYENIGHRKVTIISEMPLSSVLNLLQTDFANHYLNLLVSSKMYANAGYEKQATDEIKAAVLMRGLIGLRDAFNPNSTLLNNLFIVHDRVKGGEFQVIDAGMMANDYLEDLDKAKITGLPGYGSLNSVNVWYGQMAWPKMSEAMVRITRLVAETRAFKLKMELSPMAKAGWTSVGY